MLRLLHRLVDYLLVLCLIYLLADVAATLRSPCSAPHQERGRGFGALSH
jgi:hypothetical protein